MDPWTALVRQDDDLYRSLGLGGGVRRSDGRPNDVGREVNDTLPGYAIVTPSPATICGQVRERV